MSSDPGPTIRLHHREDLMVVVKREAEELLLIEEADAWFEYLEATRSQSEGRYREVEPWAWARLSQRLRAIKARRAKLRPAAAGAWPRPALACPHTQQRPLQPTPLRERDPGARARQRADPPRRRR